MNKKMLLWRIFPLVLIISLILNNPILAADYVGGNIIIAANSEEEINPAVAYNSEQREYLIVWQNDRPNFDDIYAQRLSGDGRLLGGWFSISAGTDKNRRFPKVAYNSKHNQYLVVYVCVEESGHQSLCARRVSGAGQLVDQTDLVISATFTSFPVVAYSYTSDNYLIAWIEIIPSPLTYVVNAAALDHSSNFIFNSTVVVSDNYPKSSLEIAYNRHANRHLLVWEQDNVNYDIVGRQVLGDGSATWGSIVTYADESDNCRMPDVAALPTGDSNIKFFVAFHQPLSGDYGIFGRLVNEDGSINSQTIAAYSPGKDHMMPAVTASESLQEYFVVWQTEGTTAFKKIEGLRFNAVGTQQSGYIPISEKDGEYPDAAAGLTGDFLAVWQSMPVLLSDYDIYGQILGNRVFLPLVLK